MLDRQVKWKLSKAVNQTKTKVALIVIWNPEVKLTFLGPKCQTTQCWDARSRQSALSAPRLPASEVATRANRNLRNVFMEIVHVSRLQRAEHIDNCRKRPTRASNTLCPCGFFCCPLKGAVTGWGWSCLPAQLTEASLPFQCLCLHCCPSSSLVSAAWRLPQLREHKPALETWPVPEKLQQWHLLSPWACTEPSQVRWQHLALVVPYLPSLKQMAAGDRRDTSTCQTPGSGYPNGIPSPENKQKFIILVWLQRKTHSDSLFCQRRKWRCVRSCGCHLSIDVYSLCLFHSWLFSLSVLLYPSHSIVKHKSYKKPQIFYRKKEMHCSFLLQLKAGLY